MRGVEGQRVEISAGKEKIQILNRKKLKAYLGKTLGFSISPKIRTLERLKVIGFIFIVDWFMILVR